MTDAAASIRARRDARPEFFTVNQLAEELGITARAIRFYEAKGLIAPRRAGTTRVFDRRDRARLLLVLRGKRLGFSLASIREFLDLYDADRTQSAQLRLLLDATRERIRELERQRVDLDQTLRELREVEAEAERVLRGRGEPRLPADAAD
ncbi:MAG TPA: MerR family DNA-binding transcriptional regulator [Acetobacteraceae bacterium]|nr:MerR family DNA-binding transcriptional regulator [Acetobacteraceae bacterium]